MIDIINIDGGNSGGNNGDSGDGGNGGGDGGGGDPGGIGGTRWLRRLGRMGEMRGIIGEIALRYGPGAVKTGEICPSDAAPVLALENGLPAARLAKWGFPRWGGAGLIINARAETALEKPMFRAPLLNSRCAVPSSGFYEWDRLGGGGGGGKGKKGKADKYLLRREGAGVLYMAGMLGRFADAAGAAREAFVILTTAASPSVAGIHDRMPVLLSGEELELWLSDRAGMERLLRRAGPELSLERQ
ncbi:MAG: SOS response-associated peptidase [Clostridiales bacterium]|nr:SOS response-associated peptidase [Clostridiales bacterium]